MKIHGLLLDEETRCEHYNSPVDIIAIKMFCCKKYYACIDCHNTLENHKPTLWSRSEQEQQAIYCGHCQQTLSIKDYLHSGNACPNCNAAFNPACSKHYHLYFEIEV